jgi:hypothetical protein
VRVHTCVVAQVCSIRHCSDAPVVAERTALPLTRTEERPTRYRPSKNFQRSSKGTYFEGSLRAASEEESFGFAATRSPRGLKKKCLSRFGGLVGAHCPPLPEKATDVPANGVSSASSVATRIIFGGSPKATEVSRLYSLGDARLTFVTDGRANLK